MVAEIYTCYYGKAAHELRNLPGIIYLKTNRCVCFYDEKEKVFFNSNMEPFDLKDKVIIPSCYIDCETEFFDAIKSNGGIIPCGMEDVSSVEHWTNFYEPNRKIEIIKGRDLINPQVLDFIEKEYGKVIFFKTMHKSYSSKLKVDDLRNDKTLIHSAISLHPDDEFIISEYMDLLEDEIGLKEYRIFVYDGKVLNISRCTEFVLHDVDESVFHKALEVVDKLKQSDFPLAYVLDLCEYRTKEGNNEIDVIEFNPFMASGHYLYNSVDYIPCDDMLHSNLQNIAIEFRDLLNFCRMPDEKYKNLIPSKYYHVPGSFAYDLKHINDFCSGTITDYDIDPGKIVDKYLEHRNKTELIYTKTDRTILTDIIESARESTAEQMKQLFLVSLKQNKCPINVNYLCASQFPVDFNEKEENPQELTINQEVLNCYIESHYVNQEEEKTTKVNILKKVLKING